MNVCAEKKTCENEIENVLKRMSQEHEFWNILIEINSIQIKKNSQTFMEWINFSRKKRV